jgi:hypothetical protein
LRISKEKLKNFISEKVTEEKKKILREFKEKENKTLSKITTLEENNNLLNQDLINKTLQTVKMQ